MENEGLFLRKCEQCGKEFFAKKETTRFCSSNCCTKFWKVQNRQYFHDYQAYYRSVNKKIIARKRREYFFKNPEKFARYAKNWRDKNPERWKEIMRDYMKETGWNTKVKRDERKARKQLIAETQARAAEAIKIDNKLDTDIRTCKKCGTLYRYKFDFSRLFLKDYCCYECYLDDSKKGKKLKRKILREYEN
jgi:uncharacterized OB-fold protein